MRNNVCQHEKCWLFVLFLSKTVCLYFLMVVKIEHIRVELFLSIVVSVQRLNQKSMHMQIRLQKSFSHTQKILYWQLYWNVVVLPFYSITKFCFNLNMGVWISLKVLEGLLLLFFCTKCYFIRMVFLPPLQRAGIDYSFNKAIVHCVK